jgi:hypothetical protein
MSFQEIIKQVSPVIQPAVAVFSHNETQEHSNPIHAWALIEEYDEDLDQYETYIAGFILTDIGIVSAENFDNFVEYRDGCPGIGGNPPIYEDTEEETI